MFSALTRDVGRKIISNSLDSTLRTVPRSRQLSEAAQHSGPELPISRIGDHPGVWLR